MNASTGSRIVRASSGSRSAKSSIELFTSAKRTVTCLRSPSRTLRRVRIFSARYRGVKDSGELNPLMEAPGATAAPHCLQNLFVGGLLAPQAEQVSARRAPHSPQKLASARLSRRQRGHCMLGSSGHGPDESE